MCLNVPPRAQPEAYIGGTDQLFDASGKLADERTRATLSKFIEAYAVWVIANTGS